MVTAESWRTAQSSGAPWDVIYSEGYHIEESEYRSPTIRDSYRLKYEMDSSLLYMPGFELQKPIPVEIRYEDDYCFIVCPELDITEGGPTLEEALAEFEQFFGQDYVNYQEADDEELTDKAKKLKRAYRDFAKKIQI